MNKRAAGFTLIESMICLAIIAITFVPFMALTDHMWNAYHRSLRDHDERVETDGTAYRIKAVLESQGSFLIQPDNKGASWSTGRIDWVGEEILLQHPQGQRKLAENVQHFSLHTRAGKTYLTLVKNDPINERSHRVLLSLGDKDA